MRRTFPFFVPTLLLSLIIQIFVFFLLWFFYTPIASQALAAAPITPSGLNTQVSGAIVTGSGQTQTTQYDITGGTRPGGGVNLFHSFGDFNVPTHNIANFLNAGSVDLAGNPLAAGLPTSNILGRVTDVNPSVIFGTIQTNGTGGFGNANLFLMNPYGFLFGPNATVNVGGMVAFTTADYLRLAGGVLFNATPNPAADVLLSAAPVAAFGFLGSNPTAIAVQGSTLVVQPAQSISLVGGNQGFTYTNPDTGSMASVPVPNGVTVTGGQLLAPSGQVNIASVASPGEILVGTLAQAPNINGQSFGALGTIQISEQSVIDVSGNGGGTVLIRGGQFLLDNSTISANTTGPGPVLNGVESTGGRIDIQVSQKALIQNGALIDTSVTGNATPGVTYGGVHIKADQLEVQGIVDLDTGNFVTTSVQSTVAPGSTGGNSGDIKLEANSISVKDLGQITNDTGGAGDAGNVFVTAYQSLVVDVGIIGSSSILASGNAGNIELTSTHGNILITNASIVTTQAVRSSGNAGTITVNAREGDVVLSGNDIFGAGALFTLASRGTGAIGGIQITGKNLQLLNGSSIEADTFFGVNPVKPGNINVSLAGSLSLDGGSFITTIGRGPAPAADLNITAHDVNIAGGSFLTTDTVGSGPGGILNISTNNLQLTNGGQVRSGTVIDPFPSPGETPPIPSGQGGTINIQGLIGPATSVLIDGVGSGIFTNAVGTGAAGNTNITAQSVTIQNGGTISAATSGTATSATGGNVTVDATNTVTMNSASITGSSTGPGNTGNIQINAGNQFAMTNSSVTTEANQASGGAIKITTTPNGTVQLTDSVISASVLDGTGGGGSVNIDPQLVLLLNSQILAQAVQGPGGNISITTNFLLPDANSTISASSQFGTNGTVTIQSPNAPISGQIQPLGKSPLLATTLLNQHCASLADGQFSSFTVAGRDSLPTEPGSWLASPLALGPAGFSAGSVTEGRAQARVIDPAQETTVLSLRQIAPAGFLTQAFAVESPASCQS